jgi:hypothetical protein
MTHADHFWPAPSTRSNLVPLRDVSYNAVLEAGGVAVGEKVKLEIDAELVAPEAWRARAWPVRAARNEAI